MTAKELEKNGYRYHHTASRRGYTRVADIGTVMPYKGRFGTGYIMFLGKHYKNGRSSTQFEDIAYYVK